MKASETKCPNCGAPFEAPISANRRECAYCGGVFNIDVSISKTQTRICDTELPAQKLLKINKNKTFKEKAMQSFEMLCGCLNENYIFEDYMDLFKKMADSNEYIATPTVHKDLLNKVCAKASISSNERAVFWNSNGIISKSKSGVLLTDRNIYFITKIGFKKMSYGDVKSIDTLQYGNVWCFNKDINLCIDNVGCTDKQLGIILAFICTRTRDFNIKGYKITVG